MPIVEFDFADVKPSVLSTMTVGVMAILVIIIMKIITNLWGDMPIIRQIKPVIDAV